MHQQSNWRGIIPVFEPTFETRETGLSFDAHGDKSNIVIPWAAGATPELPTALHDLTAAVRYPRRTFEYCRMAVEVIRRHFDPANVRDHRSRHPAGEAEMCAALRVTRKSLQTLDAVAARSRHGELAFSISWEMRKRALELAWELVARFENYLLNAPHAQWSLLDVRLDD